MSVQQTSLDSYVQLKLDKKLGQRQQQVFIVISAYPRISDKEISEKAGLPINCVTGRRGELLKMGYIKEDGRKYDEKTDREVIAWRALQ